MRSVGTPSLHAPTPTAAVAILSQPLMLQQGWLCWASRARRCPSCTCVCACMHVCVRACVLAPCLGRDGGVWEGMASLLQLQHLLCCKLRTAPPHFVHGRRLRQSKEGGSLPELSEPEPMILLKWERLRTKERQEYEGKAASEAAAHQVCGRGWRARV